MTRESFGVRFLSRALCLLVWPSSYLLVVSLGLTVWAKLGALSVLGANERSPGDALAVLVPDFAVFLGLAGLFAAGESTRSWLRPPVLFLATVALVLAGFNAFFLAVTGGQLSAGAVVMGLERTSDAWEIATRDGSMPLLATTAVLLAGLPIGLRRLLRAKRPAWLEDGYRGRSRPAFVLTAAAGLAWLLIAWHGPRPTLATALLAETPLVRIYASWVRDATAPPPNMALPSSGERRWLVADLEGARALAARSGINVVMVVLESTRFDHVDLPGVSHASPARTPNLRALAERGTWVDGARAVVPHTTKSLFTLECGRLPAMQPHMIEANRLVDPVCLARVLRTAGYRTVFLQSAIGVFESRASLVDLFGYETFRSWEHIRGEPLGYLSSDDRSLPGAFERWLDAQEPGAPFYATLLTSGTHHPYMLPSDVEPRGGGEDRGEEGSAARYAQLVELEDQVVGAVVAALEARGLLDRTLVVAVGDHGEGLPGDRVRQHDNNYLEMGLKVPLVLAGPGVPRGRITRSVSLVDVAPTILGRLGVPSALPPRDIRFGRDLLGPDTSPRPSFFGCFYYNQCYGWVDGLDKIVTLPGVGEIYHFDLRADPGELAPRVPARRMLEALPALRNVVLSTQMALPDEPMEARVLFGEWRCTGDGRCRHPSSPRRGFHVRRADR